MTFFRTHSCPGKVPDVTPKNNIHACELMLFVLMERFSIVIVPAVVSDVLLFNPQVSVVNSSPDPIRLTPLGTSTRLEKTVVPYVPGRIRIVLNPPGSLDAAAKTVVRSLNAAPEPEGPNM